MTTDKGNLFEALPDDLSEEAFTPLVVGGSVKIERIVSKGHSSPASGWYDQEDDEWVIVLKGEAAIGFEDDYLVHLKPGDHITIPAHSKHRVEWTKPDTETVWLAVHYR